ncbi:MAG TPA: hypothetical protein VMA55_00675 [Acidovorax sp.]|nr:hypothetical protein [Acidovorax sp.]
MNTPVNTKNTAFNFAAKHCGLSVEELLSLKGEFPVADLLWERLGDRVQCSNGRALLSVDRSELLAQVNTDGLVVVELSGDEAAEVLSELGGLELEPTARSEWNDSLARAGFTSQSQRHELRESIKGGQR